MNKVFIISILLFWVTNTSILSQTRSTATLEIRFTGIRNSNGNITIGINNSPEGWPREPQMNDLWKKQYIEAGVITAIIINLDYGTYAISVLDDENSNQKMDMFIGIPKEGWGFSRNPPFKLSAPNFEACSFLVNKPYQQITIDLRYAGKGR